MDKAEQDLLYIEQYLENQLSEQERTIFEERLKNDEAFEKLLLQTRQLISGIAYSGRNKLLQELQQIEASMPEIERGKEAKVFSLWHRKYLPWAVAACISLLIMVSVFVVNDNLNSGTMALYQANYSPYPNIVYPIKRGDLERVGDREFAYQAYDLEDYERAIELFGSIPESELQAADLLYLGNAYLAAGDARKAAVNFEKLLKSYDKFAIQGKWYLSLSYLKQGKTDASKDLLREIIRDGSSYSENAAKLLDSLE